jgi:hypothetical protein
MRDGIVAAFADHRWVVLILVIERRRRSLVMA